MWFKIILTKIEKYVLENTFDSFLTSFFKKITHFLIKHLKSVPISGKRRDSRKKIGELKTRED